MWRFKTLIQCFSSNQFDELELVQFFKSLIKQKRDFSVITQFVLLYLGFHMFLNFNHQVSLALDNAAIARTQKETKAR